VVVLSTKVYVYRFSDLKLIDQISTVTNPRGLISLCPDPSNNVLAIPGALRLHATAALSHLQSFSPTLYLQQFLFKLLLTYYFVLYSLSYTLFPSSLPIYHSNLSLSFMLTYTTFLTRPLSNSTQGLSRGLVRVELYDISKATFIKVSPHCIQCQGTDGAVVRVLYCPPHTDITLLPSPLPPPLPPLFLLLTSSSSSVCSLRLTIPI
jgi:hypothetical protein